MEGIQNRRKLACPTGCAAAVYDVMLGCWRIDPNTRTGSRDVEQRLAGITRGEEAQLRWSSLAELVSRTAEEPVFDYTAVDTESAGTVAAFESLRLQRDAVELGEVIGSGAFGEVRAGSVAGGAVAVKTLLSQSSREVRDKFEMEARILCAVKHAHVVRLVGFVGGEQAMMVLEFLPLGDLQRYLREEDDAKVHASIMLEMCVQVCDAMCYLERLNVIHRDLAARNVLVGSEAPLVVKLSDVGLARTLKGSDYYRKTSNEKACLLCWLGLYV